MRLDLLGAEIAGTAEEPVQGPRPRLLHWDNKDRLIRVKKSV